MNTVILDFGSGNTAKNELAYIKRMIDELKAVDTGKRNIIIKWQLFEKAGDNIPLKVDSFKYAHDYAKTLGYETTASVFDVSSLMYLMTFNPCFIKIANDRKLDKLIGLIPRKYPVYVSVGNMVDWNFKTQLQNCSVLACISEYPASIERYEGMFERSLLHKKVSDHTIGFELFNKYKPDVFEKHFVLEDSTGLDAGPFSVTPAMLREIL